MLISAALQKLGKPRQTVVQAVLHGTLLASSSTVEELESRLRRSKFDPYVSLEEREEFLDWIHGLLTFIAITETITACRDPKDDKFLELAVSGQADLIISSDHDLLVLHPFRGISILKPAAFLDTVTS